VDFNSKVILGSLIQLTQLLSLILKKAKIKNDREYIIQSLVIIENIFMEKIGKCFILLLMKETL